MLLLDPHQILKNDSLQTAVLKEGHHSRNQWTPETADCHFKDLEDLKTGSWWLKKFPAPNINELTCASPLGADDPQPTEESLCTHR